MGTRKKHDLLKAILNKLNKVIVAYSGGVDSTFLLKVAVDMLGVKNVLACTSVGPAESASQLKRAASFGPLGTATY